MTSKITLTTVRASILRCKERRTMARKRNEPVIVEVAYEYIGSDRQFNDFLKSVIREYISNAPEAPEAKEIMSEAETA